MAQVLTTAFQVAPFDELIVKLRACGLDGHADSLSQLKGMAWTTSSELIGELGRAVLRLRKQPELPAEIAQLVGRCMSEVRKVWPNIRPS